MRVRIDRFEFPGERIRLQAESYQMRQPSQLGQRNLAGEVIVGEFEPPKATETGYSGGKHTGEAVVREIEVFEVGP